MSHYQLSLNMASQSVNEFCCIKYCFCSYEQNSFVNGVRVGDWDSLMSDHCYRQSSSRPIPKSVSKWNPITLPSFAINMRLVVSEQEIFVLRHIFNRSMFLWLCGWREQPTSDDILLRAQPLNPLFNIFKLSTHQIKSVFASLILCICF